MGFCSPFLPPFLRNLKLQMFRAAYLMRQLGFADRGERTAPEALVVVNYHFTEITLCQLQTVLIDMVSGKRTSDIFSYLYTYILRWLGIESTACACRARALPLSYTPSPENQ